jgi:hypothetical protein
VRIKLLVAWLIVAGAVLTACLLVSDRTLNSAQLAQVRTACIQCHSSVPTYNEALKVHDIHSTFSCSRCHSDSGLQSAAAVHHGFEWLGIVIGAISLGGVIANFVITSWKTRTK